jgi:hypothetical protein
MTSSNPKKSRDPDERWREWEAGREDRAIDKLWVWDFYCAAEDRSLDRLSEMLRRQAAAARAILDMKTRLICAGLRIKVTSREHAMVAADFEDSAPRLTLRRLPGSPAWDALPGLSASRRRSGRLLPRRRRSGPHGSAGRGPNPPNPQRCPASVFRPGRIT